MADETTNQDTDRVTPEVVTEDTGQEQTGRAPKVTEPSKLIRIASMTRAMLDEVRDASLDDAGKTRLVSIYEGSLDELKEVLSEDLVSEIDSVFLPITESTPSEAEIRIVQAQLVGWLEGLFHGIQASLITQQMAASAQLESMRERKALAQDNQPPEGSGLYL